MRQKTQMYLTKGTSIEDIEKAIRAKYGETTVNFPNPSYAFIYFNDGHDNIQVFISLAAWMSPMFRPYEGVYLSLGYNSNSVIFGEYLCKKFGGYLNLHDEENEYIGYNLHLYEQGKEFTKSDDFKHKVMANVGYDKFKTFMILFDEYFQLRKTEDMQ
jgi:hypothetical protein